MAKNLLNVNFSNLSGTQQYNIGCNSSGSIPRDRYISPGGTGKLTYSKDFKLNQVGGLVVSGSSDTYNWLIMTSLYTEFTNAGYGSRVLLPKSALDENEKYYLNGQDYDSDGNPMPYLTWEDIGFADAELVYYSANGSRLGRITLPAYASNGGVFCGKLYDDGTFTGISITALPYSLTNPGTYTPPYSTKYYVYGFPVIENAENLQIINKNIIRDLQEYLPVEPEGEFTDNGNGDFDATSDPIDFPNLPSLNVIDTGMTQIYEMTSTQLRSLSNYLWTSNFSTALEKMFNDPMESILNLSITPVDLTTGALTSAIRIGNLNTTVMGQRITAQYKMVDFGTINMNEYWANFGDYSPYTKLSIYLPYVGVQQISIDDVQNGSIQLKCVIDVLTGSIQYMLYSIQGNRRGHGHRSILYTWGGNCQYQVPLSASNMTNVITSIIGATGTIAGAIGATFTTHGLTAPMAVGAISGAVTKVANAKTHVQRGGGLGGAVGLFGVQYPYLILERPEQIAPENYPDTMGIPNESTDYIKNYEGFVKVRGVNLNIPTATTDEIALIENLLKGGVLV